MSIQEQPDNLKAKRVNEKCSCNDSDARNEEKYQKWLERQHRSMEEEPQAVLPEEYKQARKAKTSVRNAQRVANRLKKRQELEALLASNPAVSRGRELLQSHNERISKREMRIRQRQQEQKRLAAEKEKEIQQRFGYMRERLDKYKVETQELKKQHLAQVAALEAEKRQQKAKKLDARRKREEYEKRRDARRARTAMAA